MSLARKVEYYRATGSLWQLEEKIRKRWGSYPKEWDRRRYVDVENIVEADAPSGERELRSVARMGGKEDVSLSKVYELSGAWKRFATTRKGESE